MNESPKAGILVRPERWPALLELVRRERAHTSRAEDVGEYTATEHFEAAVEEGIRTHTARALTSRLH